MDADPGRRFGNIGSGQADDYDEEKTEPQVVSESSCSPEQLRTLLRFVHTQQRYDLVQC